MKYIEPWMKIDKFDEDVVTDEFEVISTIYDDTGGEEGGFDDPFAGWE